jgi:hypothetical protein
LVQVFRHLEAQPRGGSDERPAVDALGVEQQPIMSRITAATGAGQTVMQPICISGAVSFVEANGRGAGRQKQSPLGR